MKYPETDESGQFWHSTLLDIDTRLRVACGIAKDEALGQHRSISNTGPPDSPPPTISDGWGGSDNAPIAVYRLIPE